MNSETNPLIIGYFLSFFIAEMRLKHFSGAAQELGAFGKHKRMKTKLQKREA